MAIEKRRNDCFIFFFHFDAGTSRFNSAHEVTLKICVILSPQPNAQIQMGLNLCVTGLNLCVRLRGQNLVAAIAFSREIRHDT